MQSNIRQAAINAIKEGDIRTLKALKAMIGSEGTISTYFQVFGSTQLYYPNGSKAEPLPDDSERIEGILPNVSSVIVTFPTKEDMESMFKEDEEKEEFLRLS